MLYFTFGIGALIAIFAENKKIYYYLFLLLITLLAIFRYGVGIDYFNYEELFISYGSFSEELFKTTEIFSTDLLFRLFGSLHKTLGLSFPVFIATTAVFQLYFAHKIAVGFSNKPILVLLVYLSAFYIWWTYSGLRQGVALTLGVYFFLYCLKNNRDLLFVLMILIAALFHASAIIVLPAYFIVKYLKLSKRTLLITSIISIMVSFIPLGIVFEQLRFIPIVDRAAFYFPDLADYSFFNVIDFASISRFFFLLIGFIFYDFFKKDDFHLKILNTYILFLNLYFLLKFSELIAGRISLYGFFLIVIILPYIYASFVQEEKRPTAKLALLIIALAYFQKDLLATGSFIYTENQSFLIPYTHIFDKNAHFISTFREFDLNE